MSSKGTTADWAGDEPVVWTHARVPGSCRLTELAGFDTDHWLTRGQPLVDVWPEDVRYGMDPQAPKDMLLLDSVRARRPIIVASERLTRFVLDRLRPEHVEALPITLVNHKKRAVDDKYFVINPIGQQDCLDVKKCRPTWSDIDRDSIDELERLVIDPSRIDPTVSMFRPRHFRNIVLVRSSLAKAIDEAGFSGVVWTRPADYR